MTSEIRNLVEPADLVGIEIACPECQVKVSFPISNRFKLAAHCPHCNKPLFDETVDQQTGSTKYPAIDSIHKIVANLWALRSERTDIHGQIRFEIKDHGV
jgi:uncharacterized paraquat-inducible protein A